MFWNFEKENVKAELLFYFCLRISWLWCFHEFFGRLCFTLRKNVDVTLEKAEETEKVNKNSVKNSKIMEIIKVDPVKEENPLELEGKAAFDILSNLLDKAKKPEEPIKAKKQARNHKQLPSCLQSLVAEGTKKFPCTMCGKLFIHPDQLVVHANEHLGVRKWVFHSKIIF